MQLRTADGSAIDHPTPASLSAGLSTGSWCSNAVLGVAYTLTHDGAGHVGAASAVLLLGNVTVDGDFAAVQQSYGVEWVSSASVTTSFAAGNAVARDMSGNPGYQAGKPVLAGTLETDAGSNKQAVAAWASGLLLDDCSGVPAVGVTYGDAMAFGCAVTLTLAELEAMCTSKSQLEKFGFTPTCVSCAVRTCACALLPSSSCAHMDRSDAGQACRHVWQRRPVAASRVVGSDKVPPGIAVNRLASQHAELHRHGHRA